MSDIGDGSFATTENVPPGEDSDRRVAFGTQHVLGWAGLGWGCWGG